MDLWKFLFDFFDILTVKGLVSGIVSTVVGVALGIPVAFWIERKTEERDEVSERNAQAKMEKEKKEKILKLLWVELKVNEGTIHNWNINGRKATGIVILGAELDDSIWVSLSEGGELQWIKDYYEFILLAQAYAQVKYIKQLCTFHANSEGTAEDAKKEIYDKLVTTINGNTYIINSVVSRLEIEVKKYDVGKTTRLAV